ncbi:MAG: NfeD family protein [Alloprevotella sp.]|nr:NfeD family protein [Bacteroidales bacterium]MDY3943088.1 NfeD family protein [Alloprevotella sp.]
MTIILILFALAILLALVEVYLAPGFGIAGLASGGCAIGAIVTTYQLYGIGTTFLVTIGALVAFFLFIWYLSRTIAKSRMALQAKINSVSTPEEQLAVGKGDTGHALTRLNLVGRALINGLQVEVRSEEGFLDEGTPVVVSRTVEGVVYVVSGEKK